MKPETRFGKWYRRHIGRVIPPYGVISLVCCFILNSAIYTGTQLLLADVERHDFTSDIDNMIPFVKEWIIIYVICYVFWAVNYILVTHEGKEAWFRFAASDMLSRIVCLAFFILLPTTNTRPEITDMDFTGRIIQFIYDVDKPTNLFPSIHCLVSWFCFVGIRRSRRIPFWYKCFSCIFALLVCASTQFTKQHYLIDIFGGLFLAEICYLLTTITDIYKPFMRFFMRINEKVFGGPL